MSQLFLGLPSNLNVQSQRGTRLNRLQTRTDNAQRMGITSREAVTVRGTARRPHFSRAFISVTVQLWTQVFWIMSVYFNIRNTLPKSGTFLLGHPVYKVENICRFRHFRLIRCVFVRINLQCSSVGIGTRYGLDGPWINYRCGRDFPHASRPVLRPTQPPVHCVPGLFPGDKSARGVELTTHPLQVPRLSKGQYYTLPPLWAFMVCFGGNLPSLF